MKDTENLLASKPMLTAVFSKGVAVIKINLKIKNMKATELRISNYVNFKNREDIDYCEVTALDTGGYIHLLRNFKDGDGDDQPEALEDITPIILTEQWLGRFGFEKFKYTDEVANNGYKKGRKFELQDVGAGYFRLRHFYMELIGAENTHVQYVHELQNLFYALTKEELVLAANPL